MAVARDGMMSIIEILRDIKMIGSCSKFEVNEVNSWTLDLTWDLS